MLELYFWPTPNGKKVTILLEECALPYVVKPVHIGRGDQFHPDYLRISPNNRMPALVDTQPADGGAPISIFESAAIMMYVAEKAGRFYPQDTRAKYEVTQWLMWQMANQGPKMGEQGHFRRAAEDPRNGDQSYAIRRFDNEVHRLFGVLNLGLHGKSWLAAGEYTIADMICYPWASYWQVRGIDLAEFENVAALDRSRGGAAGRGERHGRGARPRRGSEQARRRGKGAPGESAFQPARRADPQGMGRRQRVSAVRGHARARSGGNLERALAETSSAVP